jgi:hypothetical protein
MGRGMGRVQREALALIERSAARGKDQPVGKIAGSTTSDILAGLAKLGEPT